MVLLVLKYAIYVLIQDKILFIIVLNNHLLQIITLNTFAVNDSCITFVSEKIKDSYR